ncbi:MAG: RNHCP domain-containing protein [Actinomycetia bacterium]|nr:RNHCP domain-containing protein [Actinomycetota bacterium]MCG2794484.1 RNHCP domain-containing protein [Actinomycetes bacterium]
MDSMEPSSEKKCVFCGAVLEGVAADESGEYRCRRCGATGRFERENLVAILIPRYDARLMELETLEREISGEIDLEGMKGQYRDMQYIQKKHLERQGVLSEFAFLSHFRPFVEKW